MDEAAVVATSIEEQTLRVIDSLRDATAPVGIPVGIGAIAKHWTGRRDAAHNLPAQAVVAHGGWVPIVYDGEVSQRGPVRLPCDGILNAGGTGISRLVVT